MDADFHPITKAVQKFRRQKIRRGKFLRNSNC